MQSRLEQAYRKMSLTEIEKDSLTQEKDRAVRKLQEACEDINKLTHKLSAKKKELESTNRQLESTEQLRHDHDILRRDIISLQHGRDVLELENSSLRKENGELRETVDQLRQSQLSRGDVTSHSRKMGRDRSRSRSRSRVSHARQPTSTIDDFTGFSKATEGKTSNTPDKDHQRGALKTQNITSQSQRLRGNDTMQSLWMPQPTETGFTDKTSDSRPEFVEIDDPSFDDDRDDDEPCQTLDDGQQREERTRDATRQSQKAQRPRSCSQSSQKRATFAEPTVELGKTTDRESCPALSKEARRVLDGLCEHNCQNCTVCSRITHRGVVTPADAARGKKRVTVPRPIPATDRNLYTEDPTMRPSQPPGHALALVIKGLEDEVQHLQLELSRLQAQYSETDKAVGRRERVRLADGVRALLKQLEAKNDQVYNLYDVLEGQKVAEQEMTDEELEMTVLNVTGMTVRDVTGAGDQLTWEGIVDM